MVVAELKTKVEKYETKASRCEQQAREATDKAEQIVLRSAGRLLRQPGHRFPKNSREAAGCVATIADRPVARCVSEIRDSVRVVPDVADAHPGYSTGYFRDIALLRSASFTITCRA